MYLAPCKLSVLGFSCEFTKNEGFSKSGSSLKKASGSDLFQVLTNKPSFVLRWIGIALFVLRWNGSNVVSTTRHKSFVAQFKTFW